MKKNIEVFLVAVLHGNKMKLLKKIDSRCRHKLLSNGNTEIVMKGWADINQIDLEMVEHIMLSNLVDIGRVVQHRFIVSETPIMVTPMPFPDPPSQPLPD